MQVQPTPGDWVKTYLRTAAHRDELVDFLRALGDAGFEIVAAVPVPAAGSREHRAAIRQAKVRVSGSQANLF